jgi:ABC-type cobalamin/Fe3+-siderophores transport system ATPase subunit
MVGTPIILAEGVTKRFGTNQVLTRVSLPVMERDVVCVVGPSGSGKTTLLRCLALLEMPSEGRVVMQGVPISTAEPDKQIKAAIGADWGKRIKIVNQQGDPATIGSWLKKTYQFAHAMIYNEVLVAKRNAKEKYFVYTFPDFGIDWPENVLFTTEDVIKKHPEAVQAFVAGRYQGYKYALANRQEAVQILLKSNSNLKGQEAHEIEGMAAIESVMVTESSKKNGLGYVDPEGWNRVVKNMMKANLFKTAPDATKAYTTKFRSNVTP